MESCMSKMASMETSDRISSMAERWRLRRIARSTALLHESRSGSKGSKVACMYRAGVCREISNY